jgi:branched-chain amino acid transport system substrate-binding protein
MNRWIVLIAGCISAAALGATVARAEVRIGVAGPLTGTMAWFGEQQQRGAEMAVAVLNQGGGVLGQQIELLAVDDYCDGEQGVAAARKLLAAGVVFVAGHQCSGASILASELYEAARVVMISPSSTNPRLTERGLTLVFRVVDRDDQQAKLAGDYLAAAWAEAEIAILHDGTVYGRELAEETRRQLERHGVQETVFAQITPGEADYSDALAELEAAGVDVLFYGGYTAEAALLMRQANSRGYGLQLVGSDNLNSEYFLHVAGPGAEGVRFVSMVDPRTHQAAAPVVERFRAEGYEPEGFTLYGYAVVEVWAQAVEKAGSLEAAAVASALRSNAFETVLGTIGFDDKGDVTGVSSFTWYIWRDGDYVELEAEAPH